MFSLVAGLLMWTGIFSGTVLNVQAAPLQLPLEFLAEANPIDQTFGAGTIDQIQGKVKKDIGTTQKAGSDLRGSMQNAAGQLEGTSKQLQGQAEQGLGKLKGQAEDAGKDLENASENVGEAIKNFFGQ
ncbi:MAG: hypothetical protein HC920_04995 [Oscillatoriales cyanobacterium SM2_3_0]|nr:hypothetical protein [Oscillatoriales cyanobacterium SM2_3_0]